MSWATIGTASVDCTNPMSSPGTASTWPERRAIAQGEPNGKRWTEPSAGGRSPGPGAPLPATAVGRASATALAWATRRSSADPPADSRWAGPQEPGAASSPVRRPW